MNKKLQFLLAPALILAFLLAACGPLADPLAGTSWTLVAIDGKAPLAGTDFKLSFEDGRIGGQACNLIGGGYRLSGKNKIATGELMSTMMYCGEPEGIMEQEIAFTQRLSGDLEYSISGDRLTLTSAAGELVFEKAE